VERAFGEIIGDGDPLTESSTAEVLNGDLAQARVRLGEAHVAPFHRAGNDGGGVSRTTAHDSYIEARFQVEKLKQGDEGGGRGEDGAAEIRMERDGGVRIREPAEFRREPLLQVEGAQRGLDRGTRKQAAVTKGGYKMFAPAHALRESVSRV